MIKKLAKNIFLVFEFFTNSWTLSGKRWRHGTDEEWGGFSEGWKLQMEKYSPYPVLCKRSQLGPVRSSSVCSTWLLLGAADAWQMAGLCAVRFQLLFFFSPILVSAATWLYHLQCIHDRTGFHLWGVLRFSFFLLHTFFFYNTAYSEYAF